ncbi:hypothetical protein, partial [Candidatus Pelagibacter communis]|uniref:hypothetical protein n=1 Tax=Pelagibacter ubique TaxID=198252 RepID=UPI001C529DEB
ESVTGTSASFTIVAHEVRKTKINIEAKVLDIINRKLIFIFNQHIISLYVLVLCWFSQIN